MRTILRPSYIPILPLLQAGGVLLTCGPFVSAWGVEGAGIVVGFVMGVCRMNHLSARNTLSQEGLRAVKHKRNVCGPLWVHFVDYHGGQNESCMTGRTSYLGYCKSV